MGGDILSGSFRPDEHYSAAYIIRGFLIFVNALLVANNTAHNPPSSKRSRLLSELLTAAVLWIEPGKTSLKFS